MLNQSNITRVKRSGAILWRARLHFPFDPELGIKPKPKDFYGKTKREAAEKRASWKPIKTTLDRNTTFLDYLKSEFDQLQEARFNARELSWQRLCNRRSRLRRFLLEAQHPKVASTHIRKVSLAQLKPQHLEDYFNALLLAGVSAGNRNALLADLRLALAPVRRRVPNAYEDYFENLRPAQQQARPQRRFNASVVLDAVTNESLPVGPRALVGFIFMTLCRPSEMFALEWSDIDLRDGTVRIDKAVRFTPNGYAVDGGTKTGSKGNRTRPLNATLLALLRSLKKSQLQSGTFGGRVFLWKGRPLTKERTRYAWRDAKKILGLPDGPTFYSLKKLGNSLLGARGASPEARAALMGHTTPRMAMQTYRDVANAEIVNATALFDDVLTERRNQTGNDRRKQQQIE